MKHTDKYLKKKADLLNCPTKECIKCHEVKTKDDFSTDRQHADGKYPICHKCKSALHSNLYRRSPEIFQAATYKWSKNNPEKIRAHSKLNWAVSSGKVIKPTICQKCGNSDSRLEAHHWQGYNDENILNVQWLCHKCHQKLRKVV